MLDYKALEAFAAVVREENFERAAKKLRVTQSAVSQRIKILEENLGQPLLIRSSPPVATAVGARILKHYQQVHSLETSLADEISPEQKKDFISLSIGTNADSLATWLLPALRPVFIRKKLLIELRVDDQDQTQELLRTGEVFGCITSWSKARHGCSSTYLGEMRYHLTATPEFKKRYFKEGVNKKSILRAPAVVFNRKDRLHSSFLSRHFKITNGDFPYHLVPSSEGFVEVALAGAAYGLIPDLQFKPQRKKGLLVDLLPDKAVPVKLYWQTWYLQTEDTKAVSDSIISYARKVLG